MLFFWEKGFFFNRSFFYFDEFFLKNFTNLYGFGNKFLTLWYYRCENFYIKLKKPNMVKNQWEPTNFFIKPPVTINIYKNLILEDMPFINLYLLNYYLLQTWPIAKHLKIQNKFNVWFYYLTRTYRGYSLRTSKPLKRRTRYRTYYKPALEKPKNTHYDKTKTSNWF